MGSGASMLTPGHLDTLSRMQPSPDTSSSSSDEPLTAEEQMLAEIFFTNFLLSDQSIKPEDGVEPFSSDKLSREIQQFHEAYVDQRANSLANEMLEMREKTLDQRKVNYPINLIQPLPWVVWLVLHATPQEYVKEPKPAESYKLSMKQTINCLYQYVKVDTQKIHMTRIYREPVRMHMKFLDVKGEFSAGFGGSREEALRATHLLVSYAKADKRFQRLALVVKEWKTRKFDKIDKSGAFSSYAFMLMLIQYLQAGCTPPVLPCLHKMYPDIFKQDSDVDSLPDVDIDFYSENTQELGELLIGFFDYYFKPAYYRTRKTSVRKGRPLISKKIQYNDFFIEDPFTLKNVVSLHLPYTGPKPCGILKSVFHGNISLILTELFVIVHDHLICYQDLKKMFDYNFV